MKHSSSKGAASGLLLTMGLVAAMALAHPATAVEPVNPFAEPSDAEAVLQQKIRDVVSVELQARLSPIEDSLANMRNDLRRIEAEPRAALPVPGGFDQSGAPGGEDVSPDAIEAGLPDGTPEEEEVPLEIADSEFVGCINGRAVFRGGESGKPIFKKAGDDTKNFPAGADACFK